MGWADNCKEALRRGETVHIKPRGHSMTGRVNDGDIVTLEPCEPGDLAVGDIVLVRVHGNDYLHLIQAMKAGRFLIGNNRGGTNGWVGANALFGKAVKVESPHENRAADAR